MRILVIGNGAREHALAYSLYRDPTVSEVHVSPGNAGMTAIAHVHPQQDLVDLATALQPDLVIIGPEIPLVAGEADRLRTAGFLVFGPSAQAARIEGSKQCAKEIMHKAGVKTARAQVLPVGATQEEIQAVLADFGPIYVVKDDGLAGGKGVVVTEDKHKALDHIHSVHAAGNPVLIESFLDGPEISLFCLVDGDTVVPLLPAQDHKRVGDNDRGPNTGGMGAYTPLPWLPEGAVQRIITDIVRPVAKQMVVEGMPFSGLLYAGLAWGKEGPAVVEFNCRFGDPETQAILELLETPLAGVLAAVARGELAQLPPLRWKAGYALTVVLAAQGYPEAPQTGVPITGAAPGSEAEGMRAAGVRATPDGSGLLSAGGRVLNVVATGETLEQARAEVYEKLRRIELPGGHYRSDIALPAVEGRITVPAGQF